MGVQITREWTILRVKRANSGDGWTCPVVDILRSESAGDSTGMVQMPIGAY